MNYHFKIKGVIGSWWGTTADDIDSFLSKYRDKDVDVAICSPGGDVAEGLEIYQAFKDHGKVHAHIVGMTASIATIIAMGAKTVDMVKGSLILIHNCSTAVMEWRMANKEELDNIIAKYKKQRNDLNTIDDLMASIYSEKSGKTIQDCLAKMKTAAWLTAEDAKNFGLVDEIRADEDAKLVAMTDNIFSNNIIKEFGLPALPEKTGINENTIVDSEGNPTESFLAKTWQGLKEHFRNNQASKSIMKGKFLKVAALLGYEALENKDGFVSLSVEDMEELYAGIRIACEDHHVDIIGGDTTSSLTGLTISITCIGEAESDRIVYRNGACETDLICVSGDLGAAYMGLQLLEREKLVFNNGEGAQPDFAGKEYLLERQLRPEARRDIVERLREMNVQPTAMMDISDGLSSELIHICSQSKKGCRIYEDKIPIDYQTAVMAEEFNMNLTTCAMNGGEDYELLFTVPLSDYDKVAEMEGVSIIGHVTDAGLGCALIARDGQEFELKAQGWNPLKED